MSFSEAVVHAAYVIGICFIIAIIANNYTKALWGGKG